MIRLRRVPALDNPIPMTATRYKMWLIDPACFEVLQNRQRHLLPSDREGDKNLGSALQSYVSGNAIPNDSRGGPWVF